MSDRMQEVIKIVSERIKIANEQPFIVSVMGQTGVGKSSLINALFNTHLKTDPVRPCTKEIEKVIYKHESGHEIWFYDMPGIGESDDADDIYLESYRKQIELSDVVIWAIHADNRSVTTDLNALKRIMGVDTQRQATLISRLTFVLTKIDLFAQPPWILSKMRERAIFTPGKTISNLLDLKADYFQEVFIKPYGNLITSQTYNDGSFSIIEPPLSYDEYSVYYQGYLTAKTLAQLKNRFPQHIPVFDRLYDNYRVIPCSSLFRVNLYQIMVVIINKLGLNAIGRFKAVAGEDTLNVLSFDQAKNYCNLVVFDQEKRKLVFDLTEQKFK